MTGILFLSFFLGIVAVSCLDTETLKQTYHCCENWYEQTVCLFKHWENVMCRERWSRMNIIHIHILHIFNLFPPFVNCELHTDWHSTVENHHLYLNQSLQGLLWTYIHTYQSWYKGQTGLFIFPWLKVVHKMLVVTQNPYRQSEWTQTHNLWCRCGCLHD